VVPPQAEAFSDPSLRGRRLAFVSDVLVDGPHVIVVEQGGTLGGVPPFPPEPDAPRLDLGPLGEGIVVLGTRDASVRVDLRGGRFVRVRGTVDVDVLASVARGLRKTAGGELVFESGSPTADPNARRNAG
jgi:hypothetical protein